MILWRLECTCGCLVVASYRAMNLPPRLRSVVPILSAANAFHQPMAGKILMLDTASK
jgi:hypothetical protein